MMSRGAFGLGYGDLDRIFEEEISIQRPSIDLSTQSGGVFCAAKHFSSRRRTAALHVEDEAIYFGVEPGPGYGAGALLALTGCLAFPCVFANSFSGNFPGFVVRKGDNEICVDIIIRSCFSSEPARTLRNVLGVQEVYRAPIMVKRVRRDEEGQLIDESFCDYNATLNFYCHNTETATFEVYTFDSIFCNRVVPGVSTQEVPGMFYGTSTLERRVFPTNPGLPKLAEMSRKINALCRTVDACATTVMNEVIVAMAPPVYAIVDPIRTAIVPLLSQQRPQQQQSQREVSREREHEGESEETRSQIELSCINSQEQREQQQFSSSHKLPLAVPYCSMQLQQQQQQQQQLHSPPMAQLYTPAPTPSVSACASTESEPDHQAVYVSLQARCNNVISMELVR